MVVNGKACSRMTRVTCYTGDYGILEDAARHEVLQPIHPRVYHSSRSYEGILAISHGVLLREVGVFLLVGNRSTEDMVPHEELLSM